MKYYVRIKFSFFLTQPTFFSLLLPNFLVDGILTQVLKVEGGGVCSQNLMILFEFKWREFFSLETCVWRRNSKRDSIGI